jgi:predicted molibdopterin-dependent oxidoreductase YjgC
MELGVDLGWDSVDDITDEIASTVAAYDGITVAALATTRDGIVAATPEPTMALDVTSLAVADRNSYDFRLVVSRRMFDGGVNLAHSPSMAPLARGGTIHLHPLDLDRLDAATGTAVKVSNGRATIVLAVEADADVVRGTAWVPFNQPGAPVGDLIDCTAPVVDVRIETL